MTVSSIQCLVQCAVAVVDANRYEPGIGDPTWTGWTITAAYVLTAVFSTLLALRTFRVLEYQKRVRATSFWLLLAVLLVFLGLNKQLDLQEWLRLQWRAMSAAGAPLHGKTWLKVIFVIAFGAVDVAIAIGLALLADIRNLRMLGALAGLVVVGCFVAGRAFGPLDSLLHSHVATSQLLLALEPIGLAITALATFPAGRAVPPSAIRVHA